MNTFLPSRTGRFRPPAAASEALDRHLTEAIADLSASPPVEQPAKPEPNMTNPADAGQSVRTMMEEHARLMGEIQKAQAELLRAALQRQRDTVATAVGNVAEKIEGQTADFLAIMGQFSNDLGGLT